MNLPSGVDSGRRVARFPDRKDMLLEAGLTLASELSLPMVLQRIVDLAAQVTDARYGALGVIGERDTLVEFVTTGIPAKKRRAIGNLPTGRGVLGVLIHEPRPVRIKNIADHPQSVGFPANHPPMRSFLGAPVQAMGRVFGNIYLAEKRSAEEFSQEDEDSLVILATQAGVAIANASLYEEVHSRERWLDALRDIMSSVLSGARTESLLDTIAKRARDLAAADAATVMTSSATPGQLVVSAAAGSHANELRGHAVPLEGSISGAVIRSGQGMIFDDVSHDPRGHQPIISLGRHGPAFFVPLRVPGGVAGTLMVANLKGGKPFTEETRRLVASLSLQGTALTTGKTEATERIERAVEQLDGVIGDLRNYIFGLRPGILADRQLDQALHRLGEEMQSRSREHVVDVSVDAALAAMLSTRSADIVQLTREALSNVARHAKAAHASVRLERKGSQAVLYVEDDGVGFRPSNDSPGNGLRNMRERATRLGGALEITSAAGTGTALRVTFPV